MTLKLYGSPFSTSTQRVAIVLQQKHVQFEFITIDLIEGEHKAPAFVPKQPFAQVPFISDEGFMLHRFQTVFSKLANFDGASQVLGYEKWFKSGFTINLEPSTMGQDSEADEAVVAEKNAKLEGTLNVYEIILSKQLYVAGNERTLADLFHLQCGARVKGIVRRQTLVDGLKASSAGLRGKRSRTNHLVNLIRLKLLANNVYTMTE
ncbi:hypothetical protein FIBSPDRAFT_890354 [Athelia psychrophila]|uniref:glutathione transferase n=1 Tax=Athelia psychrophila TaxID=1759441 RepID=A0A166L188_9AGAM|nr:hypothetical protein FIBSPDRAFT_890354 [Fibularhizoctonia sp. CBS 109695]